MFVFYDRTNAELHCRSLPKHAKIRFQFLGFSFLTQQKQANYSFNPLTESQAAVSLRSSWTSPAVPRSSSKTPITRGMELSLHVQQMHQRKHRSMMRIRLVSRQATSYPCSNLKLAIGRVGWHFKAALLRVDAFYTSGRLFELSPLRLRVRASDHSLSTVTHVPAFVWQWTQCIKIAPMWY